MGILSEQDLFSSNQAITVTVISTNNIDNRNRGNLSRLDYLDLHTTVTEAFTGLTSLRIDYIESDNADMSSSVIIDSTVAYIPAQLNLGRRIGLTKFPPSLAPRRYIALNFVLVGTATAGRITSGFTPDIQTNRVR